mmetsp:Transcript_35082/g.105806  ORF Transcript_35082/g.105806 Transcript_35082/m.105806 type:complete len:287 (-) Transcript_35082:61-921(-)
MYFVPAVTTQPRCSSSCRKRTAVPARGVTATAPTPARFRTHSVAPPSKSPCPSRAPSVLSLRYTTRLSTLMSIAAAVQPCRAFASRCTRNSWPAVYFSIRRCSLTPIGWPRHDASPTAGSPALALSAPPPSTPYPTPGVTGGGRMSVGTTTAALNAATARRRCQSASAAPRCHTVARALTRSPPSPTFFRVLKPSASAAATASRHSAGVSSPVRTDSCCERTSGRTLGPRARPTGGPGVATAGGGCCCTAAAHTSHGSQSQPPALGDSTAAAAAAMGCPPPPVVRP